MDDESSHAQPNPHAPPRIEIRRQGGVHSAPDAASPQAGNSLPRIEKGSLRLFRLAGTDVFIHWSWFLAAYFLIQNRGGEDTAIGWRAAQYFLGVGIVLLHEFGHVLACRQVGGIANRVVLWPLGGLALATPPPRPGALLWTVAAGPLVNVALLPVSIGLIYLSQVAGWEQSAPEWHQFLIMMALYNGVILAFNILPIYPLDGGQILQALLWFAVGRATSLAIASVIGMIAGLGLTALAIYTWQPWFIMMALFLVLAAWGGYRRSRALALMARVERRHHLACPACGSAPPVGEFWRCTRCLGPFDLFAPDTTCPAGGQHATNYSCIDCGRDNPPDAWLAPYAAVVVEPPPK